jgi:hypothetical protein
LKVVVVSSAPNVPARQPPTDLLDILWLNEEGLKLAPDMEEIGIDSKSV